MLQKRCGQLKHCKRLGRSQAKPLWCIQEGCKGVAVSNSSRGLGRCITSWVQNKRGRIQLGAAKRNILPLCDTNPIAGGV